MKKTDPLKRIPILPISPMTLVCPLCDAKPGKNCKTDSGGNLEIVHVARITAAARVDAAKKEK